MYLSANELLLRYLVGICVFMCVYVHVRVCVPEWQAVCVCGYIQ